MAVATTPKCQELKVAAQFEGSWKNKISIITEFSFDLFRTPLPITFISNFSETKSMS